MLKRFIQSRGVRKFRRDRFAVVAFLIVLVYLTAALAIALGAITREDTTVRVGPDSQVGSFETPTDAQRLSYVSFHIDTIETAAKNSRGPKAYEELELFGAVPAIANVEEAKARVDELWKRFDELSDISESDEGLDEAGRASLAEFADEVDALWTVLEANRSLKQSWATWLGTDRQGRSILLRALYSIKVAVQVGLVAAFVSVLIGTILGGIAAFFGGWVDHVIVWLYSMFSAIPYIVLLMVLASMFLGCSVENTLIPVYVSFCMTFWIGPCRVIRGEVMKLRELEYVQAATTLGFGRFRVLLRHVLPNTAHLMFINFSLLFVGAIKAEVILSFLNLGVKNQPSWGVMISQAKQEVIGGFFWQIGAATFFMFVLVLAFNILSDALQDAFDPKHVG